jgi:RNA polymerase sigma-70 factor (ECF subfamily)
MNVDDHELIERCRSGDDTAFAELVGRYKDLVFGLIYRMIPDRSAVEDLAQDVFLKIHRGIPYFRGEARLSTWIFRIVQNVCVQWQTDRRQEPRVEAVHPDQTPRREPGSEDTAFGDIETRDRLQKAISQLPPNYQLLIAAHYLRGVQYEALAEALNIPLGTVKTHLYRAKRRLRELLEE